MPSSPFSFAVAGFVSLLAAFSLSTDCRADAATPTAAQSAPMAPSAQDPTAPAGRAPGETAPSQTPPPASSETPRTAAPETKQGEDSTAETVELPARPFAYIEGKADRDGIYAAILGSLGVVKRDLDKAGIKPAGRPLAVFVESDDSGFRYHAGYPLETPPQGGLSDAERVGQTPSGKAMRFEHLGSYADIDATYDAITAYLDEKGIDAQDSFVEEYANDVKDPDDPTLQVNIYVLLK